MRFFQKVLQSMRWDYVTVGKHSSKRRIHLLLQPQCLSSQSTRPSTALDTQPGNLQPRQYRSGATASQEPEHHRCKEVTYRAAQSEWQTSLYGPEAAPAPTAFVFKITKIPDYQVTKSC